MSNFDTRTELWLSFQQISGLKYPCQCKLAAHFSSLKELKQATANLLARLGCNPAQISAIKNLRSQLIAQQFKLAEKFQAHILSCENSLYPQILKQIPDPPSVLYALGNLEILNTKQLAIVGTRQPSARGLQQAREFSQALAKYFTITSGLAAGIDAAAHQAALQANAHTVAVLGNGLDLIYPPQNRELFAAIPAQGGVIISEFGFCCPPRKQNFPLRNRIISGLSLGVLVVEAQVKSGSLITARLAAEHGREVFAIPGNIADPLATGCHYLIQSGAKLVQNLADILDELPETGQFQLSAPTPPQQLKSHESSNLAAEYLQILECIADNTITPLELIVAKSSWQADKVNAMLTILELDGYCRSVPGGYIKQICQST